MISAKVFAEVYTGTATESELDGTSGKTGDYYLRISSNRSLVDPAKVRMDPFPLTVNQPRLTDPSSVVASPLPTLPPDH